MSKKSSCPVITCQICESKKLSSIIFLGYIPPVNTMLDLNTVPVEEVSYPLELLRCDDCGLVQIGLDVSQSVLFPESYPYLSGTTRILRDNFYQQYIDVSKVLELKKDDLIIDIGSNDGTLLSNYHDAGYSVLGIEPSQAADVAIKNNIRTLKEYFNIETAKKVRVQFGLARVITACNVFAHITNVHSIVEGVLEMLSEDGVFVSESHYLPDLVETLQYDTIYHEHLRYYHLGALIRLLDSHGLEVFAVKKIPTHGGSIRVFAARKGLYQVESSVIDLLKKEDALGITDGSGLIDFKNRVVASKLKLYALLADLKNKGARVYGIGAPSRSSTLINYVGLDDGLIDAVMEVSTSHKLNKYVPGTRIPVFDEKMLYENQPDFALIFSWHIAGELSALLKKNGYRGQFITPLPDPYIFS